jgi:DHA1 family multidrug resistance protein-like MFS transporter
MLHAIVSDRPGDASVQAEGNPLSGLRSVPRDAVLLGVGLFLVVASANVLTPLLPLVQRDFAVDYTTVGLLVSAYGVARLALDLPAGFLQQRLGVPTLAGVGFALLVAASILAALGPSFELVLLGRIGMGLGTAILSVVVLTTLNELAPEGARTRVLVVYSVANNAAIGFFPVVGGILGELAGWRSTMLLCAVLGVLSGALLGPILSRASAAARSRDPAAEAPFVLDGRTGLAIGAIYFGVVIYMINRHGFRNTALPLFAADRLGLSTLAIASGITLMAVAGLLVAIPGSVVADRWSRRRVIVAGFLILAVGDLAFLGATDYSTFLLAALILGLGDFFSASQAAALTESVPPRWRSRALAAYRFSVDLGATIGPALLAGLLQVAGYRTMIAVTASLLLLAGAGALVGERAAAAPRARG